MDNAGQVSRTERKAHGIERRRRHCKFRKVLSKERLKLTVYGKVMI